MEDQASTSYREDVREAFLFRHMASLPSDEFRIRVRKEVGFDPDPPMDHEYEQFLREVFRLLGSRPGRSQEVMVFVRDEIVSWAEGGRVRPQGVVFDEILRCTEVIAGDPVPLWRLEQEEEARR